MTGEYDFAFQLPSDNYSMFEGNQDISIYKENAGSAMTVFNKKEGLATNPLIRKAVIHGGTGACNAGGMDLGRFLQNGIKLYEP